MAPVEATINYSNLESGISDSARAREVYKYYTPNAPQIVASTVRAEDLSSGIKGEGQDEALRDLPIKSDITSSKISSPDTALTAFCQLVTWRTGAQRAMIGLLDADTQYFIAESTKTVDLMNAAQHAPGDDIWMGCSSVSKAGKLCERTIQVRKSSLPGEEEIYPNFIVNDLEKDERFNQLPFVTGPPNLRFYAGVPLITKKNIAIGSLFIVDDRVRNGLSKDDIHFMGTMATTIMAHLEMVREVEERRRGMKMNRGLSSFVQGRAELLEADADVDDEGTGIVGLFEPDSGIVRTRSRDSQSNSVPSTLGSTSSTDRKPPILSKTEGGILDSPAPIDPAHNRPDFPAAFHPGSHASVGTTTGSVWSPRSPSKVTDDSPDSQLSEESSQRRLTSRAANLIRETFEVDGGCIFYDAQAGSSSVNSDSLPHSENSMSEHSQSENHFTSSDEIHSSEETPTTSGPRSRVSPQESTASPGATFTRSSTRPKKVVDILGFSTPNAASIHGDDVPGPECFRPFQEKSLHTLLRRYPKGKLWTFGSDGEMSSSSEEEYQRFLSGKDVVQRRKDLHRKKARMAKTRNDAKFLAKHFPGVRELLFVPLWDAGRSRWLSGCFVWSTEPTRVLSKQSELSFLSAFGNSVMSEWSRVDTEIANQKKGDFIGSISHELRSPLHGILASAEFLSEEVQSTFEKGLVETISSCGRTLLDTINHVLDFSKINHFERTWRKSKRGTSRSVMSLRQSDIPIINLYADVDVSVICEEVVEGVYAGHIFQSGTAANFDMVAKVPTASVTLMGTPALPQQVILIFDVDFEDFHFTTQPGAFRRIVMNLLGNALKYTAQGYVRVKLTSTPMDDFHDVETGEIVPRAMLQLTVTDTGKGISPEFLRSRLFTPFTQENSLSSGTGLGLAIVKSIVSILEGDITIDSEVGRGTQVRVSLPLLRGATKHLDSVSTNTPRSITSFTKEGEDAIAKLRSLVAGQRVSLHGFEAEVAIPAIQKTTKLFENSVKNFLTQWYGMTVVPSNQKASIIISNEGTVSETSKIVRDSIKQWKINPTVVVLCSHSSRFDRTAAEIESKLNIGYVSKPIGPLKLGRAIAQSFETSRPVTPGMLEIPTTPESNDLSNVFEEMKFNAKGGEVLDNSRMAADSENARKAIESPTPNAGEKRTEFPFPAPMAKAKALPIAKELIQPPLTGAGQASEERPSLDLRPPTAVPVRKPPSFLLVDDNAINLTLLSTSIKKRKNEVIDQAMDGLAAVNKFQERQQGYDIIFMDISMPLLDGFGATKEIRTIEEGRKRQAMEDKVPFTPALVIALTGLASNEDQARAAKVGVDLFLTKPVSFKDVKKMLDNWEANREKDST